MVAEFDPRVCIKRVAVAANTHRDDGRGATPTKKCTGREGLFQAADAEDVQLSGSIDG